MIELHNIDCMKAMKEIPDKAFDLAIVDPPYGIGMDNQIVRTKPNRPNTYKRIGEMQYKETEWDNNIPTKTYFDELKRVSRNRIIWGSNYFCEFIESGYGWIYWDKQMGDNCFSSGEFAFQSLQVKSSSFSYPSMRVQNTRSHPTQKPVKLYEWLLRSYAKEGDKILYTHLGSGSIAIACYNAGYSLTGYEIDKDYYEAAMKRLEEHKRQGKMVFV